ncbi:hypothetical protein [Hymenobacter edaphi]|uniref:hypothetical protein n=1 Tax=Hymenobacter edaphi TaxID=2211146 RepID=UPI0010577331|nr:hypothetical protein [Hymenobacter edaphi]
MPWLPLLFVPAFAALLGLVSFMVSRMGWSRLAAHYAVAEVPAGVERELLGYVRIGPAKYNNAVRAGLTPQGLWLTTWKIFFIGHPPLFIPWSAFGPVRRQQFLWATTYATHLTSGSDTVSFQFSSERLLRALPPSVPVDG